jgi:outer membrane protein assembly factor BamB
MRIGMMAAGVLGFCGFCMGQANWPELLGPHGNGHADAKRLPLTWSESKNVRWKTAIAGQGWSSPVIWGKQVWMTTALDEGKSLRAICVDKATGKVVHDVEVFAIERPDQKNKFNSYASPTPVIEEGRVYVSFGNYGSACLDTATGKPIWVNQSLNLDHKEGPGSSPILYKNLCILNCDGMDRQYVVALDKMTGQVVWKTDRTTDFGGRDRDLRKAYSTPTVIRVDGRELLLSIGAFRFFAYEPMTGREVWSVGTYPGFSTISRPQFAHGLVYISTGYMKADLLAVHPTGSGDVTGSNVAWKFTQGVPCKPTPVIVGDYLLMTSDNGIARCLNAKTGEQYWQARLGSAYSASPLYAAGRVYLFSEKGETHVLEAGRELKVLAENQLDGKFMASPAVSENKLYLRTDTHLYCVGE